MRTAKIYKEEIKQNLNLNSNKEDVRKEYVRISKEQEQKKMMDG